MGQKQTHRGKHPEDDALFAPQWRPVLERAVTDYGHLLSRGYAEKPALRLVGDHYQLHRRQRHAVSRVACTTEALERRRAHEVPPTSLAGQDLAVDGYNVLITLESALSNAVILRGRDGCIRDMASIHGSYRKVEETLPAIDLIGSHLAQLAVAHAAWRLDAPVSNSGRLKALLLDIAAERGWNWTVHLDKNPDALLAELPSIAATSDSWILDRATRWTNLTGHIIAAAQIPVEVISLSEEDT